MIARKHGMALVGITLGTTLVLIFLLEVTGAFKTRTHSAFHDQGGSEGRRPRSSGHERGGI